ncbi:MAG: UDP-2,3-diacylglucosamine diphosphatase [Ectothiorhodospiraceae bacterium]|nr:UDP-2,3-diacylglucosamine diphosphatase [Ectothiorhodospiraceae bacterium]MCH8504679.1 UDP-2,3-diacylglucosamine diphosphatase [Ectothiorhodospiraceae bacterium]
METVRYIRPTRYRSIFISDTHLGFRGAQAEYLLDFLRSTECEYLFLVGDIIDIRALKRGIFWPQAHNEVLREIMRKALGGTQVVYLPGNHDAPLREYDGTVLDQLRVTDRYIHTTADGKRLLLLHGDQFDTVVQCSRLVSLLGAGAYDTLMRANILVNRLRRALGAPYWSLAAHIKRRVANAQTYITRFERAAAFEARRLGLDGVVCGHIHHAAIKQVEGVLYCNDGDWVESCTSLVERHDGVLELLHWSDARCTVMAEDEATAVAEVA